MAQIYKDMQSLQAVEEIINEANVALNDKTMTIEKSTISSTLATASTLGSGAAALAVIGVAPLIAGPLILFPILGIAYHKKKAMREKLRLYEEAIKKQNEIIRALKEERDADKKRIDYLNSINNVLQQHINGLKQDLESA